MQIRLLLRWAALLTGAALCLIPGLCAAEGETTITPTPPPQVAIAEAAPAAVELELPGAWARVVPLGSKPANERQAAALWEIAGRVRNAARAGAEPTEALRRQQLADLEQYLVDWPDSPYNPGVRSALADHYVGRLRYGQAIRHWRDSFQSLKEAAEPELKQEADRTLALWSRHLLIAGQYEELAQVVGEHGTRHLDYGPLSAMWGRTVEKFVRMGRSPEHSY